jgi:hypothetical protein
LARMVVDLGRASINHGDIRTLLGPWGIRDGIVSQHKDKRCSYEALVQKGARLRPGIWKTEKRRR